MTGDNMKYLEVYKYIFVVPSKNFTVLIQAEDKIKAINIFMEEYPKLFEMNYNIIRLEREITGDRTELIYL